MYWILLAILAHVGNAAVFVVDKSLLSSSGKISQPMRYTFFSGLLAGVAVLLFLFSWPAPTKFIFGWSVAAGILHLLALLVFFTALKIGEPSRVVPIVGSAVPLFTLIFALVVLGEIFTAGRLGAVILLLAGGILLSTGRQVVEDLKGKVIAMTILSGILFAAYFVTVKHLYDNSDAFLSVFAYSRVTESVLALFILGPVVFISNKRDAHKETRKRAVKTASRRFIGGIFVGNKTLAAGAFLLQSYAIELGSVTVVNAVQGVQYIFLLALAVLISKKWPILFREEMSRVALWQKFFGIGLVSLGLVLLSV